jgi:N-acetylglucosamine kinase-like BadF-type ATPase
MNKYIIGVDGGNTKTDYLLFDVTGKFIDGMRCGTCSHESPKIGSFEGAYIEMNNKITELLSRNNLTIKDVVSGAFGLAGVDAPFQKKALESAVEKIGFTKYAVVNDGFLGIKAASKTGTGVCSINGTGTVNVGIDEEGNWMQVGGIGYVAGDEAGGSFLARAAVRLAFDECFRFGGKTKVTEYVFKMYEIESKKDLSNAIVGKRVDSTYLIKALFSCANEGDAEAIKVLRTAGENMGRSISGCIAEINIKEPVQVILAGSVWAKATNFEMLDCFKETVLKLTNKKCDFIVLKEPPVLGAILWALELANNELPNSCLKQYVLDQVIEYQNRF